MGQKPKSTGRTDSYDRNLRRRAPAARPARCVGDLCQSKNVCYAVVLREELHVIPYGAGVLTPVMDDVVPRQAVQPSARRGSTLFIPKKF